MRYLRAELVTIEQIARVLKLPLEIAQKEAENYHVVSDSDLIEMRILEDLLNKSSQELSAMLWRSRSSVHREALAEGKQKVKLQAIPNFFRKD